MRQHFFQRGLVSSCYLLRREVKDLVVPEPGPRPGHRQQFLGRLNRAGQHVLKQRIRQCKLGMDECDPSGALLPWASAVREQSRSEKQPRSWKNSASIRRRHSGRVPLVSPSKRRVKSGYSLFPTASAIHSNRRRSTLGDTPWTSGCIPSSVSGIWPTSPTSP